MKTYNNSLPLTSTLTMVAMLVLVSILGIANSTSAATLPTDYAGQCLFAQKYFAQVGCNNDPSNPQVCLSAPSVIVDVPANTNDLLIEYSTINYGNGPEHCSSVATNIWIDNTFIATTPFVAPSSTSGFIHAGPISAGLHTIYFQGIGTPGGCNYGKLSTWGGTANVATPGSCQAPPAQVTCSTKSQCGTDGFVSGAVCSGNSIYKDYKTWTCNNPGTASSYCSSTVTPQLQNTCSGSQTCINGACDAIACSTKSQCGTDGLTGGPFCQGNGVYQQYTTWTCNNAGTIFSNCSSSTVPQLQSTCSGSQTCSSGTCTATPQCSDGIDNDNDGATDYPADFSCSSPTDNDETNPKSACQDGIDNDNDGLMDYPQDPGCSSAQDNNEFNFVNITCSSNTQCGVDGTTGANFCSGNSVYKNFITWTCNNPNTAFSSCSSSTTPQLQNTCATNQTCSGAGVCSTTGTVTCSSNTQCGTDGLTGANFCSGNAGYRNYTTYTCNNAGTTNSYCSTSTTPQLQNTCATNQTCSGAGVCSTTGTVTCSSNTQCGTDGLTGANFCSGNAGYRNYTTYTCNNAGTTNSYCSTSTTPQLQNTCATNQTCSGAGVCSTTGTVTCSSNTQCGTGGLTGTPYCSGNNVYQYQTSYTCVNPGTTNSYCASGTNTPQFQYACASNQTCTGNGVCTNNNNNTCTNHYSLTCSGNNVYWQNSCGALQEIYQTCASNQTCSGNTCVNINTNQNQITLTSTEKVRNLSAGNLTWTSSVTAQPSDIVQFQVTIYNGSNTTINNVTAKKTFPNNLYYNDNLTLDGVAVGGDITTGLNVGSFLVGQTKIITFQAQLAPAQNFSFGQTTIYVPTIVTSTDSNYYQSATVGATIIVNRSSGGGASTVSTGLTNNPFFDSFFLPLLLVLAGIWAWKSGFLHNVGLGGLQKRISQNKLFAKINEIKKRETA